MFADDFYLDLVNSEFSSEGWAPISAADLKSRSPRIVVRLESHIGAKKSKSSVAFNHYRPARYFAENVAAVADTLTPETLARFEAAFKALNALL